MAAPRTDRRKTITQDIESEWHYRRQGLVWGGLLALLFDYGARDGWLWPLLSSLWGLPGAIWYVLCGH
jgi:hypothetical protein